jgi:hypothetical protein
MESMVIILTGRKSESACTFSFLNVETPIYSFLVRYLVQVVLQKPASLITPTSQFPYCYNVRILPVPRKQCMSLTETNGQNLTVPSPTAYETTTY